MPFCCQCTATQGWPGQWGVGRLVQQYTALLLRFAIMDGCVADSMCETRQVGGSWEGVFSCFTWGACLTGATPPQLE